MMTVLRQTFCVVFCGVAALVQLYCQGDSSWVKLSGPVTLRDEWVELHPQSPLKAEKDLRFIVLELEPPLRFDLDKEGKGPEGGKGILLPDREVINPQIEVIDEDGNALQFVWRGARQVSSSLAPAYYLPYPNELPTDKVYKTVRIRSPRPVRLKAIYWYSESFKDRH